MRTIGKRVRVGEQSGLLVDQGESLTTEFIAYMRSSIASALKVNMRQGEELLLNHYLTIMDALEFAEEAYSKRVVGEEVLNALAARKKR